MRFAPEDAERVWVGALADGSGRFQAKIPPQLHGRPARAQAFFGGGKGIGRCARRRS